MAIMSKSSCLSHAREFRFCSSWLELKVICLRESIFWEQTPVRSSIVILLSAIVWYGPASLRSFSGHSQLDSSSNLLQHRRTLPQAGFFHQALGLALPHQRCILWHTLVLRSYQHARLLSSTYLTSSSAILATGGYVLYWSNKKMETEAAPKEEKAEDGWDTYFLEDHVVAREQVCLYRAYMGSQSDGRTKFHVHSKSPDWVFWFLRDTVRSPECEYSHFLQLMLQEVVCIRAPSVLTKLEKHWGSPIAIEGSINLLPFLAAISLILSSVISLSSVRSIRS